MCTELMAFPVFGMIAKNGPIDALHKPQTRICSSSLTRPYQAEPDKLKSALKKVVLEQKLEQSESDKVKLLIPIIYNRIIE